MSESGEPSESTRPGTSGPSRDRTRRSVTGRVRHRRVGPTAVIALAALIGLVVWLVVESGGGSGSSSKPIESKPVSVSAAGLTTLAGALGQPVYWVGPRSGSSYEVTQRSNGIYLRYLPRGAKAGDPRPLLTVASYPMQDALAVTQKASQSPGTIALDAAGGGIAMYSRGHPKSVYVTYPGWSAQVEVYASDPVVARRVATSGRVQPVLGGASGAVGPVAASAQRLSSLAASLDHPIYWVGTRKNVTYELTRTPDGRTYIRYLPKGVPVGTKQAYLTVGTYPLENAFQVTQRAARSGDTVTINIPGGGIAIYAKQAPTNVHIAFPSVAAQAEVFDPSRGVPPKLASGGKVIPIG